MSAQWWLRERASIFDSDIDRLTSDIEDAEKRIVDLRRRRDEVRLNRADALAAADVLDNMGFRVERDVVGGITVYVDQIQDRSVDQLATNSPADDPIGPV